MSLKSQTLPRLRLILLVVLCAIPSCAEAYAIIWGQRHGLTGKALRDGLDFWAGGFLAHCTASSPRCSTRPPTSIS